MSYTVNRSEVRQLLGQTFPASYAAEQNTSFVDMSKFHRVEIVIFAGDIGTSLDVDVEVATTTGGGDLATLKSITQLTQAGGDDNSVVVIEVRADEMSIAGVNHRYLRVESTPSGASIYGVLIWGCEPRYAPVATTALDEVVS
jgi:hypothetical protein